MSLTARAESPFYKKLPSYVSDSMENGPFYYTGYYLADGTAAGLADLTALHPTDTNDDSYTLDGDPVLAYCIEKNSFQERYRQDTGTLTKWSELKPHYNDNLPNALPKIGWVAKNGYPSVALDELEKQANAANGNDDATGSDHRDAVTATQAAIWHFSDDFTLKSNDITEYVNGIFIPVPDSTKKHIASIYNYLIKKAIPDLRSVGLNVRRTGDLRVRRGCSEPWSRAEGTSGSHHCSHPANQANPNSDTNSDTNSNPNTVESCESDHHRSCESDHHRRPDRRGG